MKRALLFVCVLGGLAIAAGAIVSTGFAQARSAPVRYLLKTNNRFQVAGSRVACRVVQKRVGYSNRLRCFRETKSLSYTPLLGSYEVELAASGVQVDRVGGRGSVFARAEVPPAGAAAGSAQARAIFGVATQLTNLQDKAYVAGTNIVCRAYNRTLRALLCVSLGRDGHIHDGTYLVWVSDRSVVIAQARNGKAVVVFQRNHGR